MNPTLLISLASFAVGWIAERREKAKRKPARKAARKARRKNR